MKQLIVSRHAKTEPYKSSSTDFGRVLTDRGHKDIILVSNYLIRNQWIPEAIYYSAAARTTESAADFEVAFGSATADDIHMYSMERLYMCGVQELLDTLYAIPDDLDRAMIIGHNPSIAEFIYTLGLYTMVPTTGTAIFSSDSDSWSKFESQAIKKLDFITPKMLKSTE